MIELPLHRNQIHTLNKHLEGAKILGFVGPTLVECIFGMSVEYPDGTRQTIEIGATDMGWWVDRPMDGKHRMMEWNTKGGKQIMVCEVCHAASGDKDFQEDGKCPGSDYR